MINEERIKEVIRHIVFWGSELAGYSPKVFMSEDLADAICSSMPMRQNIEGFPDSCMGMPLVVLKKEKDFISIGL